MKTKKISWLWVFAFFAVLELFAEITHNRPLVWASKPFLLPTLALWFSGRTQGADSWLRKGMIAGMLFSALGDVLLMLVPESDKIPFFLLGLGSFLIAHLFYCTGFLSKVPAKQGFVFQKPLVVVPFLAYLIGLLAWLWPGLPTDMRPPVAIYGSVITLMALCALNWRGVLSAQVANWTFMGALLFVLSDSLIAINKFAQPLPGAQVAIMLTYIVGQYLLARGSAQGLVGK